jgi:plasmid stabilization system protein ParE
MTYSVIIEPSALDELDQAYQWLAAQTPQHSVEWYNGMLDAIDSLEENPARCPVAPESKNPAEPVRQLLYGSKRHAYRVLFIIRGKIVLVVAILHAARENQ